MSSGSSPTATPSSGSSAPSWPNNTTNGPKAAATSPSTCWPEPAPRPPRTTTRKPPPRPCLNWSPQHDPTPRHLRTRPLQADYLCALAAGYEGLPLQRPGGVLGDQVVAAAMIDRIVHHADVIALKGASYRLRDRGIDTLPSIRAEQG